METPNDYADFWRNEIGVNVIPADAIIKKTWVQWTKHPNVNMQTEPIPQSMHDEWKRTNAFEKGIAVICGKILHRDDRKHLYLAAVDADNLMGIESMTKDLKRMATITLIEQHADLNKAHFYFYTTKPMWKKSSDYTNSKLAEKMDNNEIPAIELKGEGSHGIMYCTPSPHKDGSNYKILGTKEPKILDEVGDIVKGICEKYNLGVGDDGKVPMKVLMDNDTKILEGHNRHEGLMRWGERILRKYPKMEEQMFKDMMMLKNNRLCDPPLSEIEVDKQITSAVNFIAERMVEEEELKKQNKTIFGTDEFWTDVSAYKKAFNPTTKFIRCLECKVMIDANPLDKTHYEHKVVIT